MAPSSSTSTRAPRADAERNRRRVLDAATRVFADVGADATLNDVARAAGVGVATVYRKFPDKTALLDALVEDKVEALVRLVEAAPAQRDPGEAFRDFLLALMEQRAGDRGLEVVLTSPTGRSHFTAELQRRLLPGVDDLIDRAVRAGQLRPGLSSHEVCLLAFMVGKVADVTRSDDPRVWRRYAQLLIDGTRPSHDVEALTPRPLSFDATTAALGRSV